MALIFAATPVFAADRAPNGLEKAYTALAQQTGQHALCAKISADAVTRAAFNSPGTRIYEERANCYLHVATVTGNPALCDQITERRAFLMSGSYFSPENCRALIADGIELRAGLSFDYALLLTELGYGGEDLPPRQDPDEPESIRWLRLYLDLVKQPAFIEALQGLPDFSP